MSKEAQLKTCPSCNAETNAESRFCVNCRHDFSQGPLSPQPDKQPTAIEQSCPRCGAALGPNAAFCGSCGSALAAVSQPRPERLPFAAVAALAIVAVAFATIAIKGSAQPVISFRERLLAIVPGDPKPSSFPPLSFNRAQPKVAYANKENDQNYVFDGEKRITAYDWADKPAFSRDGKRFAFAAKDDRKSASEFIVVDGKRGPTVDAISSLAFLPDGRLIYDAKVSDKWSIFIENEKGPTLDYTYYYVYARDGKTVAYLGRLGNKYLVITDGQQGELFDDVTYLTVSRYGTTVAYRAKQNGKWCVVENGRKGPAYDSIEDGPTLSEDGSKMAYVAYDSVTSSLTPQPGGAFEKVAFQEATPQQMTGPRKYLIVGDNRRDVDYASTIYGLVFNPDGSKVAYKVRKGNKYYVMNGGVRSPDYDLINALVYAPDESNVAYTANLNGKWFVVVGETRGPSFDDVFPPFFSPDGKLVAYVAKQGDRRVMVVSRLDGMSPTVGNNVGPECDIAYAPLFSTDSQMVAYGAVQGKQVYWKVMMADRRSVILFDK